MLYKVGVLFCALRDDLVVDVHDDLAASGVPFVNFEQRAQQQIECDGLR
jgi:hypothetical protein